jgi:hypothetical protein
MDELVMQSREVEGGLSDTEAYHILYAGIFGIMRAKSIQSADADCLQITVVNSERKESRILCPIEQASFLFSVFSLKPDEKREKVILGFARRDVDEA